MSFSIQFSPQPFKFIRQLDSKTKERIENKLLRLQEDPFASEAQRVQGFKAEKIFRIRVGEYRILYLVRYEQKQILIAKVDKRSRVY